jgi:hypothetical protein
MQALRGAGYNPTPDHISWADTDPEIQASILLEQQALWPDLTTEERARKLHEAQLRRALDFAYECRNAAAVMNAMALLQKFREPQTAMGATTLPINIVIVPVQSLPLEPAQGAAKYHIDMEPTNENKSLN